MDIVNQLIEQNIERAININQILVRNEEQIKNIDTEQNMIASKNNQISDILKSFKSWISRLPTKNIFSKIWSYSDPNLSNLPVSKNINTNNYKTNLDMNIKTHELNTLQELSNQMSNMLDSQNEQLVSIQEKNKLNLQKINQNQKNINNILNN